MPKFTLRDLFALMNLVAFLAWLEADSIRWFFFGPPF
jgi:hypothetical protein